MLRRIAQCGRFFGLDLRAFSAALAQKAVKHRLDPPRAGADVVYRIHRRILGTGFQIVPQSHSKLPKTRMLCAGNRLTRSASHTDILA